MNKQNQESRDFTRKDKFMLGKLAVLVKSPLYRNSLEIVRYQDLLNVIDFTKIADMLHLITHYGAVSLEQIRKIENSVEFRGTGGLQNADNQKKRADLTTRRLHTEKYLRQYALQSIDCSLDKMFPNPIGLHDEDRWYTVASRMLLDAFTEIRLEINHRANRLYFGDEDGTRRYIDHFSVSSFAEFLEIVLHTSELFDYQLDWSEKNLKRFLANLRENERFITHETDV